MTLTADARCLLTWIRTAVVASVQSRYSRVAQKRVTFCANFSRLSNLLALVNQNRNFFVSSFWLPVLNVDSQLTQSSAAEAAIRTAQKIKITRRRQNGAEHSAPELANQLQWLGFGFGCHVVQAIGRYQTLGLRFVVPLAGSSIFGPPNDAEVRSCVPLT